MGEEVMTPAETKAACDQTLVDLRAVAAGRDPAVVLAAATAWVVELFDDSSRATEELPRSRGFVRHCAVRVLHALSVIMERS